MRTTFLCVTWRASSSSRLKRRSSSCRRRRIADDVRPDHLDGDRDFELLVPRLIDRAHAADAEQPDDVVARSEVLSDLSGPPPGIAVCLVCAVAAALASVFVAKRVSASAAGVSGAATTGLAAASSTSPPHAGHGPSAATSLPQLEQTIGRFEKNR